MKSDDYTILLEGNPIYTGIMLSTLWNQSGYIKIDGESTDVRYNEYCPLDPDTGSHSVTGCTNTAAAQIIHYFIEKKGLELTLTLDAGDEYTSSRDEKNISIKQDGSTPGTLSFNAINNLLSSYSCSSPEDIAALAYACGVVQEADYSSSATSTAWRTELFQRAGFDSVNHKYIGGGNSDVYWGEQGSISDAGFEVLIENLCAGRVVGTSYPGHALVIDGYDPANDRFHINFGWGNSSSTRWYTREEINEQEYYQFVYDIDIDSDYCFTVDDKDIYGTGTLVRAVERANGADGENQIRFSATVDGKTLELPEYIRLDEDIRVTGCNMDLLLDDIYYGWYSSGADLSFENYSGNIFVSNDRYTSYAFRTYGNELYFDGSGCLIFCGETDYSASQVISSLKYSQSSNSDIADWLLDSSLEYSFYASGQSSEIHLDNSSIVLGDVSSSSGNDILTLTDCSRLYGDVNPGSGNNSITIDSTSSISGTLYNRADICFELNSLNSNALWTTDYIYNLYSYANISVDMYDATPGVYTLIAGESSTYLKKFSVELTGSGVTKQTLSCNGTSSNDQAEVFVENNELKLRVKNYTTHDTIAPTTPGNTSVSVNHDQATFSWNISTDNIEVHHYQLRYGKSSSLTGNGVTVKDNTLKLDSLSVGKYYYQVRACDSNGNYSSWSDQKSFNIMSEKADLIITDYNVNSTSILTTQSLKLSFNVQNNGYKNAGASVLSVYKENTGIVGSARELLGKISIKALSKGESTACTYTVAAGKLSAGTNKIYLVADSSRAVAEGNENNNQAYRTIDVKTPRPDLCIKNYEVSTTDVSAYGQVKLSFNVANTGTANASASTLKVYDGNTLLRTYSIGAISTGASKSCTVTLNGSELGVGSRKIFLVADAGNNNTESNEDNNKAYRTINRKTAADLCVKDYQISTGTISKFGQVKLSFKIANNGQSWAVASKLFVYDGNTKLKEFSIGAIDGGKERNCTVTLSGSELALGSRKIYLVTDAGKVIAESNEDNNKAYRTIQVNTPAELCIKDYTVNTTVVNSNQQLKLAFKLANTGQTAAGASVLKVYDGNTLLRTYDMKSVAAGASNNCTVTLNGSELALGSRKIFVVADAANSVAESNEENNKAFRTIQVNTPANLCIRDYEVSSTAIASNQQLKLTFKLANTGQTAAGASILKVYDGNTLLRTFTMKSVAAGAANNCTVTLNGSELAPGSRKIFVVADANNSIAESNEENNKAYRTIQVNTPADLKIQNYTVSRTELYTSQSVKLAFKLANAGETDAGKTKLKVYSGNTLLRTYDMGSVAAGSHRDCTVTLNGSELGIGLRNIYVVADAADSVAESDESNNKTFLAVLVNPAETPDFDPLCGIDPAGWQDYELPECGSVGSSDSFFDNGYTGSLTACNTVELQAGIPGIEEDTTLKNKTGLLAG